MTMREWFNETLHSVAVAAISGQSNLPAHRIEDQLDVITARLDELHRPFWCRILGTTRR